MIEVERVDFVSIPTQDLDRAKDFYGVTLGLAENGPDEFDAGNVTLGLWEPETDGETFVANPAGIALRVPNVVEARATLDRLAAKVAAGTVAEGAISITIIWTE